MRYGFGMIILGWLIYIVGLIALAVIFPPVIAVYMIVLGYKLMQS